MSGGLKHQGDNMEKLSSQQLNIELAHLAAELVQRARMIARMCPQKSKDQKVDNLLIQDFEDSLKADPSIKGQFAACDIIMEVSYFHDVEPIKATA
jgi:hypothetical protein